MKKKKERWNNNIIIINIIPFSSDYNKAFVVGWWCKAIDTDQTSCKWYEWERERESLK